MYFRPRAAPCNCFYTSVEELGEDEVTYKFQSVGVILFDEVHDVSVGHPLRDSGELCFLHIAVNANKF